MYEGTTKNLAQDVLNGYNATVFAYGATGAGKTHTMVGTSLNPGIMVRALNDIFLAAQKLPDNTEFTVSEWRERTIACIPPSPFLPLFASFPRVSSQGLRVFSKSFSRSFPRSSGDHSSQSPAGITNKPRK